MADRREELRRKRLEAEKRHSSSERRRLFLGYGVAGVLATAVVVGLVIAIASGSDDPSGGGGDACAEAMIQPDSGNTFGLEPDCREGTEPPAAEIGDLQESARTANCDLRTDLPDEGNTHIPADAPDPEWKTNPPTSGDHAPEFLADGAYSETPDPRNFLHSLEHGRIEIHYSPDLSEEQQLELKGVFEESPDGMTFFPNPDMPFAVAVTAWQQLVGCDEFDPGVVDVVRNFRDTYRGQGPENVPVSL